ncbi:unnamed protein product [Caretta caretta]
MDSFTTPVRPSDFVLAPRTFGVVWRKRYSSDSSEEDEREGKGIPLAQPLMDMPESDPEVQLLMRHPHEHGGLSSSTTREEEGHHGVGEALADKVNGKDVAQLDDAFLEDPEALDGVASNSEGEPGPPCFCSTPLEIVEDDSEEDGYEEFRRGLAWNSLSQCHVTSVKMLCGLLYTLLFMLFFITVLGKSFLKMVRAVS